jgi:hypothetical protein
MGQYQQPCPDHIELRVKTERKLAVISKEIEHYRDLLRDSAVHMAECTEQMAEQVELMTKDRVELAKQDERLKTGNTRFKNHLMMITGLFATVSGLTASVVIMGFVIIAHHPEALKILNKLPILG